MKTGYWRSHGHYDAYKNGKWLGAFPTPDSAEKAIADAADPQNSGEEKT